ncbi:MAG: hypothetical protein OR994_06935, partial [Candidatus Poseidoniales archaeon]|nr:hypothetical protein [Candidatus Poseidoniales archaeon]
GVGNNTDVFPENPFETNDTDGDGVGDNRDVFPNDSTEWKDTDFDGIGNNSDAFPEDYTQWNDTDGDGYGDNQSGLYPDAFPNNSTEWEDPDKDGLGSNYENQIGTDPNDADTDNDGLSDFTETNTGFWISNQNTGTNPLNTDSDGDGLSDTVETNTGIPILEIDDTWNAPTNVSEPYEPEEIFIESELKLNVVFLGFGAITQEDYNEILNRTPSLYTPFDNIMDGEMWPAGVEYNLSISLINAPDQMFRDYNDFMNNSKTMEWKTEDYIDSDGNDYVDDAFDEAYGDDDYGDVIIDGVNVLEAENWLYVNANKYQGMEDVFDGYVLFFLNPETELWPYYYYHNNTEIDSGEELQANNLVAYGGTHSFYFIDMSTPPPSFLWGGGVAANTENNPPLWLIDDEQELYDLLAEYIDESVQFLFAPSYIYTTVYEPEYEVEMFLIDATSDDSALDKMDDYVDEGIIQRSMKNSITYVNWTFMTHTVDIDDEGLEELRDAFDDSTTTSNGCQIIDTYTLIPVAEKLFNQSAGVVTVPVFLFIVDDCGSVDEYGILGSAESYDNGTVFGVFIAQGEDDMSDRGITQIINHEIGHMIGLLHSFDGFTNGDNDFERDWFWTQCKSPMTYNHDLHNLYFDAFNKNTLGRGHTLYVMNLTQHRFYEMTTIFEQKGYDFETLPWEFRETLSNLERNQDMAISKFENRSYASHGAPGLYALDYALHAYNDVEKIISWTGNLDNYTAYRMVDYGTDPNKAVTDGEGILDSYETMTGLWTSEYTTGTNPVMADTDGDGVSDGDEIKQYDSDPNNADSDYDGLGDGNENTLGTNIYDFDTDSDGLSDGDEILRGSDPLNADTDGDGLTDGYEVLVLGSSPISVDTDGDGYNDAEDNWPTFNFELTIIVYYYNVENTDFWDEDDVYFKMSIEDSETHTTNYVANKDENDVWYNFTYDVKDNEELFHVGLQAWDYDGDEGSDDDYYDIDGINEDYVQLDLYYIYGLIEGDAHEQYYVTGSDYGYSLVYTNGQDDGDTNYHDAEVRMYIGWNIL